MAAGVMAAASPSRAAADEAGAPVDCSTPRKAMQTWLANLQDEAWHPERAVACFDWRDAGVKGREQRERAVQLKRVLDARGLWVDMESLPNAADAGGQDTIRPFPDALPNLELVPERGRWLLSASIIEATPHLYAETFTVDMQGLIEELPAWSQEPVLFSVAWWQVLGLFLVILVGILARALISWLVASQSARFLKRTGERADASTLGKAARPIGTLVMAGVIWYLLPPLQFGVRVNQVLTIALRVVAAASAVMLLYRIVDLLSDIFAQRAEQTETKLDDQLVPLVRKTLKVFVVALGIIFVLQNMDVDVGSLLAGASLGGLAFTLAARDTVANLFGSVSIFADRPFQIGDWVKISDAEGVVEEVGMRSTRIRTFHNSLVSMPNSLIANATVDNLGARRYKRCYAVLGVPYDTTPEQMQAFCDGIRAILAANEHVRQDFYEVHFSGFGAHALEVMVYFFFDTPTWSEELRQRHNVFLEIIRLARDLRIPFAYPTQTLHIDSMAQPSPAPARAVPDEDALVASVEAFGPGGALARPGGPRLTHGFFAGQARPAGSEPDEGEG
jgi:MscS family membrane protein